MSSTDWNHTIFWIILRALTRESRANLAIEFDKRNNSDQVGNRLLLPVSTKPAGLAYDNHTRMDAGDDIGGTMSRPTALFLKRNIRCHCVPVSLLSL